MIFLFFFSAIFYLKKGTQTRSCNLELADEVRNYENNYVLKGELFLFFGIFLLKSTKISFLLLPLRLPSL